jgi:hypothetical protein
VLLFVLTVVFLPDIAHPQTTVMAPGSQIPGAPLPRYVYSTVRADYSAPGGYPLTKSKFNLYDTIGPSRERFDLLIDKMGELNVDSYRLELGWGRSRQGHGMNTAVGGTLEELTYDFAPLDHIVRELSDQGVLFLGAYCYTPNPLQDPNLSERYGADNAKVRNSTPPKNLDKWKEVITAFVTHHRDAGLPFGVHEVWNEPDGTYFFFSGSEAEYFQLYKATVEAVRAVDPDAVVGGPAADHHLLWNESFPEFVVENNLPLDALTFHHYSSATLAQRDMDMVCQSLNRFDELDTATLSMTEWNTSDWATRPPEACARATQLLHDFQLFLKRPELSSVSWTTWVGLLTRDGHRRADFNAWKLYAMMPVDRRPVAIAGPLEAMASSDEHRAGLLVWNNSAFQRRLDLHMDNLPFARGTVRLYRVDRENASYDDDAGEQVVATETWADIDTTRFAWQDGYIPPYGIIYLEAEDGTGLSELTPVDVAKVIRINRYYPARGETSSYADFDRKTWIARLGMMDDGGADERIGVLATDLPDVLDVTVEVEGRLQRVSEDSLLGVRVDYRVDGKYAAWTLFHGPLGGVDLYSRARPTPFLPWGQMIRPIRTTTVDDLSHFQIDLAERAPAGWDGTAHISFIMNATGAGTRAKFTVRPAN